MSDSLRARTRLFVAQPLAAGASLMLERPQTHYLAHVMRVAAGEAVLLFNGRDGEWLGRVDALPKAGARLTVESRLRPQAPESDLWLLAAPIKRDRIDLVAEKAAELGVSRLVPVFTRRTAMTRVNTERLAAHMVEAAEQCGRLTVPEMADPVALDKALAGWPTGRVLLFLDESGGGCPMAEVVAALPDGPAAVLVGPEGGFSDDERRLLAGLPFARPVGLGPRILRAETAAIVALALWQALKGDWRRPDAGP
jgi:16S rRNA (uracil1498-N3)-methyltransferase